MYPTKHVYDYAVGSLPWFGNTYEITVFINTWIAFLSLLFFYPKQDKVLRHSTSTFLVLYIVWLVMYTRYPLLLEPTVDVFSFLLGLMWILALSAEEVPEAPPDDPPTAETVEFELGMIEEEGPKNPADDTPD
jgi:hypothetical protein